MWPVGIYLRANKAFISCIRPSPPPPLPPLDLLESLLLPDPGGLLSSWTAINKTGQLRMNCRIQIINEYTWAKIETLTRCTFRSLAPASAAASPEGCCWTPGSPPGGPPPVGSGGGMGGGTAIGGGGPGGGGGAGGPAIGATWGGATESIAGWPAETGGPGRGRIGCKWEYGLLSCPLVDCRNDIWGRTCTPTVALTSNYEFLNSGNHLKTKTNRIRWI